MGINGDSIYLMGNAVKGRTLRLRLNIYCPHLSQIYTVPIYPIYPQFLNAS